MIAAPRKPRIAQRLVDDADHGEVVLADVQAGLHLESVDAEVGRQVDADHGDRVAALDVAGVEPTPDCDVTAHCIEQAGRRGQHGCDVLVLAGQVDAPARCGSGPD